MRGRAPGRSLVVLSAFLAFAPPSAAAQPVVVKLATLAPEGSPWHSSLADMAARWRSASGGQITLRLYPGGIAGDDPEVVRKMRLGSLSAGLLTAAGLAPVDGSVHALSVPMMYSSYEELDHVLARLAPRLEAALEARGFTVLYWADGGWVRFFARHPVATPDELRALTLFTWAGDAVGPEAWRSAGFNAVGLRADEIGPALQKGRVTALGCPAQVAAVSGYYTRLPHMTDVRWQPLMGAAVVSQSAWSKVPADLRTRLLGIAREAGARLRGDIRGREARDVEAMKSRGLRVVPVDEAARTLWLKTAEALYPRLRGPVVPAELFDEALRHRSEYRAQHAPVRR